MLSESENAKIKKKEGQLVQKIEKIKANRPISKEIEIHNPTPLQVIKKYRRCVVFRIDDQRCAKFYLRDGKAEQEYQNLKLAVVKGISPDAYEFNSKYVVMELIDAPSVAEYLESNPINQELTEKLLKLIDDLKELGLRPDQPTEHIYIMPEGILKTDNLSYEPNVATRFPKKLVKRMGKQVDLFLTHVKEVNPAMFEKWKQHPDFDEVVEKARNRAIQGGDKK